MLRLKHVTLLICIGTSALPVWARTERDRQARAEFVKLNPCPVTHKRYGPCPGHQVDHVEPLAAGGADHPANMQWLTVQEHKQKTRLERIKCAYRCKPSRESKGPL